MSTASTKPRQKAFSAKEREFVANAYPALGPAAIAKKLGRSRSGVCYVIKQLKEAGVLESELATNQTPPAGSPPSPPHDAPDGRQDTLGRLKWVRSLIERQLWEAEGASAARLAKEYRDTLEAIERMEGDGGDGDALGAFADAIAKRLG